LLTVSYKSVCFR